MALTNVAIREIDGMHVAVCDTPPSHLLWAAHWTKYNATRKPDGLALVAATRDRLEELLKWADQSVATDMTIHRRLGKEAIEREFDRLAIIYDSTGREDDDARIKRVHPVPPGVDVHFRWDHDKQVVRMEAFTEKKGVVVTRSVMLDATGSDVDEKIADAYARFQRTSPAPRNGAGLKCGAHIARLLARANAPAAAELAHWRKMVEATPLHRRGDVRSLILPGEPFGSAVVSIMLEGVKGSCKVSGRVVYKNGNEIADATVTVMGDLPDIVKTALCGRTADHLWGAADLADVTIGGHLNTGTATGGVTSTTHGVTYAMVDMPHADEGTRDDPEKDLRTLRRNYSGLSCDAVLNGTLGRLDATWLLHVVRTMKRRTDRTADLGYIPEAEALRVTMDDKHIRLQASTRIPLTDLMQRETPMST